MVERPLLKKAPVVEAVVDIRASASAYSNESISTIRGRLKDFLSQYEKVVQIQAQFPIGNVVNQLAHKQIQTECARLTSADGSYVTMIQPIGMNLSRMAPYNSWNELRTKSKALWSIYCEEMKPKNVSRLGLRFVNRIEIPHGAAIENSFRTFPALSSTLPQGISDFRMQITLPSADQSIWATINQVYDPRSSSDTHASIVFDIDTYKQTKLDSKSEEVWDILEKLHEYKNDIFFESLTDSMIEELR